MKNNFHKHVSKGRSLDIYTSIIHNFVCFYLTGVCCTHLCNWHCLASEIHRETSLWICPISAFEELPLSMAGEGMKNAGGQATMELRGLSPLEEGLGLHPYQVIFQKPVAPKIPTGLKSGPASQCVPLEWTWAVFRVWSMPTALMVCLDPTIRAGLVQNTQCSELLPVPAPSEASTSLFPEVCSLLTAAPIWS